MVKQKVFRKEQLKFMIFSFISFTVIFTIFGVIIFSQVKSTLFTQTDEELFSFKEKVSDVIPDEEARPPRFDDDDVRKILMKEKALIIQTQEL
ncbi:hypothetical protein [Metabacillus sp. B2-18]|uniref:hypothetical protein n=1 Tax=Metabacillus sp. B2-18 TaxID=2897333 RepID=UPI001E46F63A|nr:hypothetical protein [Metabacillus sp. B2-18]UGB32030.1 hypothetical protein LPC09_06040 [Metabacillus sp. B2-18]